MNKNGSNTIDINVTGNDNNSAKKIQKKTLTNNNVKTNENTNKEYSSSGPRRERKTAKMINIERKQSQRDTGHASRRKALNNKTHVDKKKEK